MTVTGGDENANVAFENCAPFTKCVIHINDEQIDTAENLDIIMAMYDLILKHLEVYGSLKEMNLHE